ncbi:MAG: CRISPR-associated exonuclease Cas4 [Turneriella sp.]|nr:CRISPR-associated exonuclease Cas4 [Turneriella sp.]
MTSFDPNDSTPISQIRQFVFCPRIPWFQQNIDRDHKHPLWVAQGKDYEERRESLISKRPLFKNGKAVGYSQKFDVAVSNPTLKIHGRVDLVLETKEETIPVEIKMRTDKPSRGHTLQLMGYALCVDKPKFPVRRGIIVAGERQRRYEIRLTEVLRQDFLEVLEKLRETLVQPFLPHSAASITKCMQCEYQNLCQDRDL